LCLADLAAHQPLDDLLALFAGLPTADDQSNVIRVDYLSDIRTVQLYPLLQNLIDQRQCVPQFGPAQSIDAVNDQRVDLAALHLRPD
jgi:hypothetical protein